MSGVLLFIGWLVLLYLQLLYLAIGIHYLLCLPLVVFPLIFYLPAQIVYVVMPFWIHNHYNHQPHSQPLPPAHFFILFLLHLTFLPFHIPIPALLKADKTGDQRALDLCLKLFRVIWWKEGVWLVENGLQWPGEFWLAEKVRVGLQRPEI